MKSQKFINHWIISANDDFETMQILFRSKRYPWALFWDILLLKNY